MQCHVLLWRLLEEENRVGNWQWAKNAQSFEHFLSIMTFGVIPEKGLIPHGEYALELFDEADAPERVFIGTVLFKEFGGV